MRGPHAGRPTGNAFQVLACGKRRMSAKSSPRDADWMDWRSSADPRAATVALPHGQIPVPQAGEGELDFALIVGAFLASTCGASAARPRSSAQTSRYQLARSQRSLSQPVNDGCSWLEMATMRGR